MVCLPRGTRGIALPLAVFALVVVGALVAGAFFVARQEQGVGRNSVKLQQAFAAAEAGAQRTVADWSPDVFNALAAGETASIGGSLGAAGWYRGNVRRLNGQLFLVRAEGFSGDSTARQHVGLLVRLRPLEITLAAALATRGPTWVGGSSLVDGTDTPPPGWDCEPSGPPVAGVLLANAADLATTGCGPGCVQGAPPVQADPALTDSLLTTFGDVSFDGLASLATKTLSGGRLLVEPVLAGSACDRTVPSNWGSPLDPAGPCGGYFPLIWSEGPLTLTGGAGQGVLVVNGDLEVGGGFQFAGPVIVRGSLRTAGAGGQFWGGVIAANDHLDQNAVLGDAIISYSSCSLSRALQASAGGALLRERSWVNLY